MNHSNKNYAIGFGCLATVGWLVTFGLGLFISSEPHRQALQQGFNWQAFIASLLIYTPTNIAVLCLLASFCGGCASRLIVSETMEKPGLNPEGNPPGPVLDTQIYMSESPFSSMFRGFVVYVTFLAGVYITSPEPFGSPTPDQYARAAGTTSLLAFVVGYDPTFFRSFISLADKFKNK